MVQHSKNQYSPSHQQTREEKSQIIALDTDKELANILYRFMIKILIKNRNRGELPQYDEEHLPKTYC